MLPSEGTEDDLAKQDIPNLKVNTYDTLTSNLKSYI